MNPVFDAPKPRPAILHVAESYAGGVSASIREMVDAIPDADHDLVFSARADAPLSDTDLGYFRNVTRLPRGHLRRIVAIRKAARASEYAAVHAHSSFAGAYVRGSMLRRGRRIVYTPHCYAFERRDLAPIARLAYRTLEAVLATNTTVIAACSPREARLSRTLLGPEVVFAPNVPPQVGPVLATSQPITGRIRVMGAGRNGPQKDPDFFLRSILAARIAGIEVDASWIGGDTQLIEAWAQHDVRVTGWMNRTEALAELESADIYLHSAAWEGFPVAVLESVSAGVPTVVRSIPAFEDISLAKVDSPEQFVSLLRKTHEHDFLDGLRSRNLDAIDPFTPEAQAKALRHSYFGDSRDV